MFIFTSAFEYLTVFYIHMSMMKHDFISRRYDLDISLEFACLYTSSSITRKLTCGCWWLSCHVCIFAKRWNNRWPQCQGRIHCEWLWSRTWGVPRFTFTRIVKFLTVHIMFRYWTKECFQRAHHRFLQMH